MVVVMRLHLYIRLSMSVAFSGGTQLPPYRRLPKLLRFFPRLYLN